MSEENGLIPAKADVITLPSGHGDDLRVPRRQAPEARFRAYLHVLYRRRWTVATAFFIVTVAGVLAVFTATPVYEARAQLLIEPENPNVVSFKEVLDQQKGAIDYYQTQYMLLQSRSVVKSAMDSLKLWQQPEFGPPSAASRRLLSVVAEYLSPSRWLAAFTTPPPKADDTGTENAAQAREIDAFLARLQISPVRNTRLVQLRFRSTSPRLASAAANGLGLAFIAQNLERNTSATREAADWLNQRLTEQRVQVQQAELAMQQYRERFGAASLEDKQNTVLQKLTDLNAVVTRAKTDLIEKQALYDQSRTIGGRLSDADSLEPILQNRVIQGLKSELAAMRSKQAELSERLGDEHPDLVKVAKSAASVEARIKEETAKVVQGIEAEYKISAARERNLSAALEAQKREAQDLSRKAVEYSVLQREANTSRQVFDTLQQRAREIGLSGELKTNNIRLVDAAELPTVPVSPQKGLGLIASLFAATVASIGLAFFFESIDDRIKAPDQITSDLGLPFMGLLPVVPRKTGDNPLINNGVPANFSEAFRVVRMNVLFSSADEGGQTVVVTSAQPGEGKTLVASNLAVGIAQAGQRVLIVDADMRRPRVHDVLRVDQGPGLSDVLVEMADLDHAIRPTGIEGLMVLPSGRIPPNPAELLGSKRFLHFLGIVERRFDWVIIDTPPVMTVADASIVAHAAKGVMFVVNAASTSRRAAQAALDRLDGVDARFLGAVLNGVKVDRGAFSYSAYYGQGYEAYHNPTDVEKLGA